MSNQSVRKNVAENEKNKAENEKNKADNSKNKRKYEQNTKDRIITEDLSRPQEKVEKMKKNPRRLLLVCAALKTRNQNKNKTDQITVSLNRFE